MQIQGRLSNPYYIEPTTYVLSGNPLQMNIAPYFTASKHKMTT